MEISDYKVLASKYKIGVSRKKEFNISRTKLKREGNSK